MPEAPLPAYVNVRQIFTQLTEICGLVSLERLPRFRELLASDSASIHVSMSFTMGKTGRREIIGKLSAESSMICQRCLQPTPLIINEGIRLVLLQSAESVTSLEPEWDPWISTGPRLHLAELVEEQLMLALPMVHVCDEANCIDKLEYCRPDECDRSCNESRTPTASPFAILGKLQS